MYTDILDTLSDARAELTRQSYKVTCNQLGLDDLVAPSFEHFAAWFVIEGIGEVIPVAVLPQVHHFGPAPRAAEGAPDAEGLLAALFRRLAPARGHVLEIIGAVVADDVDEFMQVDVVVLHWGSPSGCFLHAEY